MLKTKFTLLLIVCITCGFSQDVEVKKLNLNTNLDHFSVIVKNDKVYFSHNLKTKRGRPIKDKYNGFVYSIYEASTDDTGEIINEQPIVKTELGQFNMSAPTFSKDGKYMYFTTNHTGTGTNKLKGLETFNLQIQRAEYAEGKGWTNFVTLSFCDPNFNYAHPALSPDGSTLYFVSNLKGTKGKSDLFKVSVSDHINYGEPHQLSEIINSSRTELFPFISADNKLYFSSNRRGGQEAMDIYVYDLNSSDEDQVPTSLAAPINSPGEDLAFFLNDDLTTGYITSRRYKGEGGDDVYYFSNF